MITVFVIVAVVLVAVALAVAYYVSSYLSTLTSKSVIRKIGGHVLGDEVVAKLESFFVTEGPTIEEPEDSGANHGVSRGENLLRLAAANLFPPEKILHNSRPDFMRSSRGGKLEFDVYIPDKNLALEFNGVQHYRETKHFHRKEGDFEWQQERDRQKVELCEEHGIRLIIFEADEIDGIADKAAIKLMTRRIKRGA